MEATRLNIAFFKEKLLFEETLVELFYLVDGSHQLQLFDLQGIKWLADAGVNLSVILTKMDEPRRPLPGKPEDPAEDWAVPVDADRRNCCPLRPMKFKIMLAFTNPEAMTEQLTVVHYPGAQHRLETRGSGQELLDGLYDMPESPWKLGHIKQMPLVFKASTKSRTGREAILEHIADIRKRIFLGRFD
eukprot:s1849_g4.t1